MKPSALSSLALLSSFIIGILGSCNQSYPPTDLSAEALIPIPVSVLSDGNQFQLRHDMNIYVEAGNQEVALAGEYLASILGPATGFDLEVEETIVPPPKGQIYLHLDATDRELGKEGYVLEITDSGIDLKAPDAAGLTMGIATLRQLLPPEIESQTIQDIDWMLSTGTIRDYPEYEYRGAMLDVARHFFPVDVVKRYIDYLAMYKFNRLHLHLSDDQGWRIEIRSWPRLTTIGGSTEVGGGKGGFYTQDEYKQIVEYARIRHIMVVPEIDMPGHTNAALASYPELNCDNRSPELYTGTEVGFSTLCTTREVVYQFVEDVIGELAAITPGDYIHIGGDESHVTPMEDYIPFIERVQDIVQATGKTIIGWDEIAHARLVPGTIVQYWEEGDNARKGIDQGVRVLMSPATKAYIDMQYDSTSRIGLHWAAYIEVDEAYNWDPATFEEGISRDDILGVETALWAETITDLKDIDYLAFPRLPGYGEIGWSPAAQRDWEDYSQRLGAQQDRFEIMGIGYYPSDRVSWGSKAPSPNE
ncbi:MAG TPA: beta-N-acetylhexosaminidase [Membranihabitans sp.]|nr:beta-N-acetylhexosaminidase [Membranihabitans sp.]